MLRMAICDDNPKELTITSLYISSYLKFRTNSPLSFSLFQSASELLDHIESGLIFDIYLLDILMPDINGIHLGEQLRKNNKHCKIIYLTNSPDYAIQSYSIKAYDYLMKPLNKEKFYDLLEQLHQEYKREQERYILINTRQGTYSISFGEIQYIENYARTHTVSYYLEDNRCLESTVIQKPFKCTIEPLLSDFRFLKIGASFVINMCYVKSIDNTSISMENGKKISIPQSCRSNTRKTYFEFVLKRENKNL